MAAFVRFVTDGLLCHWILQKPVKAAKVFYGTGMWKVAQEE